MKIFLVGMPGSGKSTLGKALAEQLNLSFFDLDALIEAQEGMTIPQIFNTKGEEFFREQEDWLLRQTVMEHEGLVMATGGGTPCFFKNMEFMKANGKVVFIDVPVKELAKRLRREGIAKRPLLVKMSSDEQLEEYLTETYQNRSRWYQKADIISGASQNLEDMIKEIRSKIEALGRD